MTAIDQVIASNDLIDIATKAGAQLRRNGDRWHSACPIHHGDNPTAFSVYTEGGKQKWHCFTRDCGGGDVLDFVIAWRKCTLKAAIEYLGGSVTDTAEISRITSQRKSEAEQYAEQKRQEYRRALDELRQARAWVRYYEALSGSEEYRKLWTSRGVADVWQDIWELGYCGDFPLKTDAGVWHTASLTIPIFGPGKEPLNIRHRLLNPYRPNDKYRPERQGLGATPFLADPEKGYTLDKIVVVEGEIKAMVVYITLDDYECQVIGVPGKTAAARLIEQLKGHTVYVCMDPDAEQEAGELARAVGGRVIRLRMKVDDAVTGGYLDKAGLRQLVRCAGKV